MADHRVRSPTRGPQRYRVSDETLYCCQPSSNTLGLTIEHIYLMPWVETALSCDELGSYRADHTTFSHLESDLHNLFPARLGTEGTRGDLLFCFVPGERRDFRKTCNLKVSYRWGYAQPEPAVRGEIARDVLHTIYAYGLPLPERTTLDMAHQSQRPPSR